MGIVQQALRLGIHVYEDTLMQKVHVYSGSNYLFTIHRDVLHFDGVWRTAGEQLAWMVSDADRQRVWHYFVDKTMHIVPENMIDCRILDMMNIYRFHRAVC